MQIRKTLIVLSCLAILLAGANVVFAQNASLEGKATDKSGKAVAGATVTVTNVATNQERTVATGADGRYRIADLAPGKYSIQAQAGDLASPIFQETLAAGKATIANLRLEPKLTEEVTVTGTLIPRPTLEAMSPVSTLEIEELSYRGIERVEDLLTSLPQVFSAQNSTVSNGASGTATVNLRNLGDNRTLVLIDGKRMPAGDPNAFGADLNMIPAALVKRVDILTGGASSVYGADAVTGVVNFIIDRDFEGFRGGVSFSGYQHDNNNEQAQEMNRSFAELSQRPNPYPSGSTFGGGIGDVNVAYGGRFAEDRGHAAVYLEYRQIAAMKKSARDYTNCPAAGGDAGPECGGSGTIPSGRFDVYTPPSDEFPAGERVGSFTVDAATGDTWRLRNSSDVFNYAPYNYLQRPDQRWAAGAFLNYEWNKHAQGYLDVMFMNDKTDAQIAPSGVFLGNVNQLNVDNPMLSDQQRQILLDAGWGPNDIATVIIGRRNVEGGGRIDHLSHNAWRFVGGVKGEIAKGWTYDFYGLNAEVSAPEAYQNDFSIRRVTNALIVDGDPADPTTWHCRSGSGDGCVPYNIFSAGGVTRDALNYLQIPLLSEGGTKTQNVYATVNGDLKEYGVAFPSATEGIQIAVGAGFGKYSMYFRPDLAYLEGDGAGQGGTSVAVEGAYSVTEEYLEALVPIVQDTTGAKDLSLELGYRNSNYSTSGTWGTWKAQATYTPFTSLKFRAGFNRATRSANIGELFSPAQFVLGGSTDPCAGAAPSATEAQCAFTGVSAAQYGTIPENPAGQYNALIGGNPNLEPETADTTTFGVVFTPTGKNLSATLDYYKIQIDKTIGALLADDIIASCIATGNPALCGLIHRDQFGSLWIVQGQAYTESNNQNIGKASSEGIDLNLSYFHSVGKGTLSYNLIGTYLMSTELDTGLYKYDCAGYFGDTCNNFYGVQFGLTPKWRHLFRATWEVGNASLSLGWRMVGPVKHESRNPDLAANYYDTADPEAKAANEQFWTVNNSWEIKRADFFDLAGTYKIKQNTQVVFGVNNIFDKEPPLGAGIDNIDYGPGFWGAYDVYGRYIHASLQFTF